MRADEGVALSPRVGIREQDAAVLELEGVVRHFHAAGEVVRAVDGVTLEIARGEMVAIEGPSGSGKTTLLELIAGLLPSEQGKIRYRQRDLASLSEDTLAEYRLRDIGLVHQNVHLMPRVSAIDNAALKLLLAGTPRRQARARAKPWLERLGLDGRLDFTPERLSGGERQRVAIARALAPEPGLLLADEPTGSLDRARSREVVDLLGSVARERGAGVLLVTHDHEASALADRRCALRDGRLGPITEGEGSTAQPSGSAGR